MTRRFVSCVVVISVVGTQAVAGTIRVPQDQATIQAAIETSVAGDEIVVSPGTYEVAEPILFGGKAITLRSLEGPASTTIAMAETPATPAASVVVFTQEVETSVLEGFTVTGGKGTQWGTTYPFQESGGGGIYCVLEAKPRIVNCHIVGNTATSGGGLLCVDGASPTLEGCRIAQNSARDAGAGVAIFFNAKPTLRDCAIEDNRAGPGSIAVGGGMIVLQSSPRIERCTIERNSANGPNAAGGGLTLQLGAAGEFIDTTISNNLCSGDFGNGGGISMQQGTNTSFSGCRILGNVGGIGGGVDVIQSNPLFTRCALEGNVGTHDYGGGAVRCWAATPDGKFATFDGCVLRGNLATWGGGLQCFQASPTLINCLIVGNVAEYGGAGVQCSQDSDARLVHLTVADNLTRQQAGGGVNCIASDPHVINSVAWGNDPESCCGAVAPTLFTQDPLFVKRGTYRFDRFAEVDIAGTKQLVPDFVEDEGDYHLTSGSPGVNAADPAEATAADMFGVARCGAPDLGACEYVAPECQSAAQFMRGDTNADGALNLTDAVFTLNYLFRGQEEPSCLQSADADDSGELNITDPVRTLRYLFMGDPELPVPFSECGVDSPGHEGLSCLSFAACP